MLCMAIDGACRRNGKPNCIAAGGVFVLHLDINMVPVESKCLTNYEVNSTNQRGELLGLLTALDYIYAADQSAQVITDSEYLFNTMTKEWCKNWERKGWITAAGEPVKNKDIWLEIMNAYRRCEAKDLEISFYHIKGHAVSFGKVTAQNVLASDETGFALYQVIAERLSTTSLRDGMFEHVMELSVKNNGFELDGSTLKRFVVTNTVADAIATKCVEAADALM